MVRLPAEDLDRLVRSTGQIIAESLRQVKISGELDALDDTPVLDVKPYLKGFARAEKYANRLGLVN